jgi:hypothetical protein
VNISLESYSSTNFKIKKEIERRLSLTVYDFLCDKKINLNKKLSRLLENSSKDFQYQRIYHSTSLLIKKILNNQLEELVQELKPYSLPFKLNLNKKID